MRNTYFETKFETKLEIFYTKKDNKICKRFLKYIELVDKAYVLFLYLFKGFFKLAS